MLVTARLWISMGASSFFRHGLRSQVISIKTVSIDAIVCNTAYQDISISGVAHRNGEFQRDLPLPEMVCSKLGARNITQNEDSGQRPARRCSGGSHQC